MTSPTLTSPDSSTIVPGMVSIITPYYMQAKYIRETVLSAVNQDYSPLEVIIIDDGSPVPADSSLEGIPSVRLIRTENHGCAATRNYGFQQSRGEFIIFLDGDDVLQPGAIQAHIAAMRKKPEAGLAFAADRVIDDAGEEIQAPHVCKPRRDYLTMLFYSNPIRTPGVTMMRRSAFEEAGCFDSSLSAQVDDYELYLRMARRHPFARHTACVLNYRLHGSNVSRDGSKMRKGTMEVLDRLESSGNLTASELRALRYGRRRWLHGFEQKAGIGHLLEGIYHKLRAMLDIPINAWFKSEV
jgi:glycosyltransferase involved in cell wall biosynthesis